jgi:uncharacterized DUF497 family protein
MQVTLNGMQTRRLPTGRGMAFRFKRQSTFAVEIIDERMDYGEERINLIGMGNGVILHVTYTERSDRIRLISARRAEKHEQDHYYSQNAQEWDDR